VSFRRDSIFIFGSRAAGFVLQAAGGLLVARLLGPAGRGELALLFILPTVVAMLLGFGIGTANAYFASQHKNPLGHGLSLAQLYYNSLWLGLLFGIAGIVAIFFSEEWIIAKFLRGISPAKIRLATIAIPLLLFYNFFQGLAQGERRFGVYNGAVVLRPFFFLLVFLLSLLQLDDRVQAGLWAYGLGYVLPVLWLITALRPRASRRLSLSSAVLKAQMQIGLPSYIAELLGYLFFRVNLLLIGYFLSGEHAGYFAIVLLIAESLWFLANSVSTALLPVAAGRSAEHLRELVPKVVRHVVFLTACCVAALFAVDRWLIGLSFGEDFLPAVIPLRLLYPGIVAASATKVFASYLLSQRRPHLTAMIGALGMAGNVLLSIWLIPLRGTGGAALSVSCSYLLMALVMGVWFVRKSAVPAHRLFWLRREDLRLYVDAIVQLKARFNR
jgi:O-antigen/teichoic acid export membrane protein